ncbi:tRNA methyltransferase 2 [Perkinsus chesapeaki]|uniref:tRNA methyltransferase 2 n=1 Tax=Perkinsus chesapeaki TaxID=330153 RepID=A0A7J6M6A6_PERCH|nr:tRNA methyltransferase 2 [Perkinsus chesapeaki]
MSDNKPISGQQTSVEGSDAPNGEVLKLQIFCKKFNNIGEKAKTEFFEKEVKSNVNYTLDAATGKARYVFVKFKSGDDTAQFKKDVAGLKYKGAELDIHDFYGGDKRSRKVRCETEERAALRKQRRMENLTLKQMREKAKYEKDKTLLEKSAPLYTYSYTEQLKLKEQFIMHAARNFTREVKAHCDKLQYSFPTWARVIKGLLLGVGNLLVKVHKNKPGCIVHEIMGSPEDNLEGYRNKCELTIGYKDYDCTKWGRELTGNQLLISSIAHTPLALGNNSSKFRFEILPGDLSTLPTLKMVIVIELAGTQPEVGFVRKVEGHELLIESGAALPHIPACMKEIEGELRRIVLENYEQVKPFSRHEKTGTWRQVMLRWSPTRREMLMVVMCCEPYDKATSIIRAWAESDANRNLSVPVSSVFMQTNNGVCDACDMKKEDLYHTYISIWGIPEKKVKPVSGFWPGKLGLFDSERRDINAILFAYSDIYGDTKVTMDMLGLEFPLQPASFFQTNVVMCKKLYTAAVRLALTGSPDGDMPKLEDLDQSTLPAAVVDVCSGVGTITQVFASILGTKADGKPRVYGLELVADAVEDAKASAKANGLEGAVKFIAGRAEDTIEDVIKEACSDIKGDQKLTVIVDPPRSGLHPNVLRCLRQCSYISRIVYVSCNPDTLSRDVVQLTKPENDYTTVESHKEMKEEGGILVPKIIIPVDMFPHTYHCEAILLLDREPLAEVFDQSWPGVTPATSSDEVVECEDGAQPSFDAAAVEDDVLCKDDDEAKLLEAKEKDIQSRKMGIDELKALTETTVKNNSTPRGVTPSATGSAKVTPLKKVEVARNKKGVSERGEEVRRKSIENAIKAALKVRSDTSRLERAAFCTGKSSDGKEEGKEKGEGAQGNTSKDVGNPISDRFLNLIPFKAILAAMSFGGILRIIANPNGEYDYIHEEIRELWDPTPVVPPRPAIVERHPLEGKYRDDDEPLYSFEMPNKDEKLRIAKIRESEWEGELPEEDEEIDEEIEEMTFMDKIRSLFAWRTER